LAAFSGCSRLEYGNASTNLTGLVIEVTTEAIAALRAGSADIRLKQSGMVAARAVILII
jgi:hypothetical protein